MIVRQVLDPLFDFRSFDFANDYIDTYRWLLMYGKKQEAEQLKLEMLKDSFNMKEE